MFTIAAGKHTFADPVFNRVDGVFTRFAGLSRKRHELEKICDCSFGDPCGYDSVGIYHFEIQSIGLFNPNGVGNMEESLSFHTIISFMTNTNLQHYSE